MIADYMEPITGYRAWNVHHNGLLLGQSHAEPWQPYAPFVARCGHAISSRHISNGQWVSPPIWGCSCGVYAFNSQELMDTRVEGGKNPWVGGISMLGEEAMVWGEVRLWGKVILHELGYRAEFAYPGDLWCEDESLCSKVSQLYGVNCRYKAIDRELNFPLPPPSFLSLSHPLTRPAFWKSKPPSNSVPSPAQAKFLHQPSLSQIRTIAATPWQQQQAQMQAKQIPLLTQNWRDLWRDGFKVKKADGAIITAPIQFNAHAKLVAQSGRIFR